MWRVLGLNPSRGPAVSYNLSVRSWRCLAPRSACLGRCVWRGGLLLSLWWERAESPWLYTRSLRAAGELLTLPCDWRPAEDSRHSARDQCHRGLTADQTRGSQRMRGPFLVLLVCSSIHVTVNLVYIYLITKFAPSIQNHHSIMYNPSPIH